MRADPKRFTGELAEAIDRYHRLATEAQAARAAVPEAHNAVKAAAQHDLHAAVQARVSGQSAPKTAAEAKAREALERAENEARVAEAARYQALLLVDDVARDPSHRERMDDLIAKNDQAIRAAVSALERLLTESEVLRAERQWVARPATERGVLAEVQPRPMATALRKPNGEPSNMRELLTPVREALDGPPQTERNPAAGYGIPAGAVMAGPWGTAEPMRGPSKASEIYHGTEPITGAAARMFAEIASGADTSPEEAFTD